MAQAEAWAAQELRRHRHDVRDPFRCWRSAVARPTALFRPATRRPRPLQRAMPRTCPASMASGSPARCYAMIADVVLPRAGYGARAHCRSTGRGRVRMVVGLASFLAEAWRSHFEINHTWSARGATPPPRVEPAPTRSGRLSQARYLAGDVGDPRVSRSAIRHGSCATSTTPPVRTSASSTATAAVSRRATRATASLPDWRHQRPARPRTPRGSRCARPGHARRRSLKAHRCRVRRIAATVGPATMQHGDTPERFAVTETTGDCACRSEFEFPNFRISKSMRPDPLKYFADELESLKQQGLYRQLRVLEGSRRTPSFDHNRSSTSRRNREGVGGAHDRRDHGTAHGARTAARRVQERRGRRRVSRAASPPTPAPSPRSSPKTTSIISDELNHASIIDGCRLSRAPIKVFPHKDVDAARTIMKELPAAQRKLLITDGVFSMDGDLGAAAGAVRRRRGIRRHHDGRRCACERRVRTTGRGTIDHFGCHGRVDIQVGTLVEGDRRARRLRRRHQGPSSSSSITARGRSCSRPRIRRRSPPRASPRSTSSSRSRSGWSSCGTTRVLQGRPAGARVQHRRSESPITPVIVGEARAGRGCPTGCSRRACSPRASASRPSPAARRGCAPSSPPPTPRGPAVRARRVRQVGQELGVI